MCGTGFQKTSTSISGNNITCMKICKDGEYRDLDTGNCPLCINNCFKCVGNNSADCISCNTNYKLTLSAPSSTTGTCGCAINDGFFVNDQQCVACHASCKSCSSPTSANCNSCKANFIEIRSTPGSQTIDRCLAACNRTDEFYDSVNKTCKRCNSVCLTCIGGGDK